MIEEHEKKEKSLQDLIDLVERDDLPTNEFTIQDKDPMVILGKLNEVIAYLQTLQATINASDSKANEALQKAIQAVADANQALSVANGIDAKATQALANAIEAVGTANTALTASNTALSTANTAISTANTALSSANSAVETAENALGTAGSAETKADTAITTANGAKTTAESIDAKATTALANSQTAVSTANTAETKAQEALDQVVAGQGTKVYRDTQLLTSLDIKPIEDNIANNATAINALDTAKVDKVAGKQLSTEDFTTTEKNKLAGLNNYDDTQVRADITALQNGKVDKVAGKQLSTEDFTTAEKNKLAGLNNYDDTQVQANLSSLNSNKADKNNANQSIVAGSVTASTGNFTNITNELAKKMEVVSCGTVNLNGKTIVNGWYIKKQININGNIRYEFEIMIPTFNFSSLVDQNSDKIVSITGLPAFNGMLYDPIIVCIQSSPGPTNDYMNSQSMQYVSSTGSRGAITFKARRAYSEQYSYVNIYVKGIMT